jgi:hypothetical protein
LWTTIRARSCTRSSTGSSSVWIAAFLCYSFLLFGLALYFLICFVCFFPLDSRVVPSEEEQIVTLNALIKQLTPCRRALAKEIFLVFFLVSLECGTLVYSLLFFLSFYLPTTFILFY